MSGKNIEQAINDTESQKKRWTSESIKEINELQHFQKINSIITQMTYVANMGIIAYVLAAFIAQIFHYNIPNLSTIFSQFDGNPICACNATLIIVLTLGHDDYYIRTERMLFLSDYTGLQWIDFIIKLSLLSSSILQCMAIDLFIGICCCEYILTFFRALYLKKCLNDKHPLLDEVKKKWYPHNIVHNIVMFIWTIFYYMLLRTNVIYSFICFFVGLQLNFQNPDIKNMCFIVRYIYIIIFDIYWINRVLNKKIIKKNTSFKAQYEKELEWNVEEYYNNEIH